MAYENWRTVALVAGWIVSVQGCCQKNDCMSTNTLVIEDANGAVLKSTSGVEVDPEPGAMCSGSESCSFRVYGGGNYTITFSGHKTAAVRVVDVKDDCGNYVNQTINVRLVLAEDTATSLPKHTQSASCGD